MARRRVILFLVEGTSDLTALVQPFASYFQDVATEGEAFFCDVTTVSLFPQDATFVIYSDIKETVRKFILNQIERRRLYRWTDLECIAHVVDLDGAFIPDECIVQSSDAERMRYMHDVIVTSNKELLVRRNEVKRCALDRLSSLRNLTYNKRAVPYHMYFMSRNLEHALFGIERDLDADLKERLSQGFVDKCRKDPSVLRTLLTDPDVCIKGDYAETWKYIKQGANSLHRGTNIGLLLESGAVRL